MDRSSALLLALVRVHDFRLFKQHSIPMLPEQLCLGDRGYQGMAKLHHRSCTPTKKPRQGKLDSSERQHNRLLARLRVVAEHVIRLLKVFRILAERYSLSEAAFWFAV